MNPTEFLEKLMRDGGAIVMSQECTQMTIADAAADGRMLVHPDGIGFVLLPQRWLDIAMGRRFDEAGNPKLEKA